MWRSQWLESWGQSEYWSQIFKWLWEVHCDFRKNFQLIWAVQRSSMPGEENALEFSKRLYLLKQKTYSSKAIKKNQSYWIWKSLLRGLREAHLANSLLCKGAFRGNEARSRTSSVCLALYLCEPLSWFSCWSGTHSAWQIWCLTSPSSPLGNTLHTAGAYCTLMGLNWREKPPQEGRGMQRALPVIYFSALT